MRQTTGAAGFEPVGLPYRTVFCSLLLLFFVVGGGGEGERGEEKPGAFFLIFIVLTAYTQKKRVPGVCVSQALGVQWADAKHKPPSTRAPEDFLSRQVDLFVCVCFFLCVLMSSAIFLARVFTHGTLYRCELCTRSRPLKILVRTSLENFVAWFSVYGTVRFCTRGPARGVLFPAKLKQYPAASQFTREVLLVGTFSGCSRLAGDGRRERNKKKIEPPFFFQNQTRFFFRLKFSRQFGVKLKSVASIEKDQRLSAAKEREGRKGIVGEGG